MASVLWSTAALTILSGCATPSSTSGKIPGQASSAASKVTSQPTTQTSRTVTVQKPTTYTGNDIRPAFCQAYRQYDLAFHASPESKAALIGALDNAAPLAPAVEQSTFKGYRDYLASPDTSLTTLPTNLTKDQTNMLVAWASFDTVNYHSCVVIQPTRTPLEAQKSLIATGYLAG